MENKNTLEMVAHFNQLVALSDGVFNSSSVSTEKITEVLGNIREAHGILEQITKTSQSGQEKITCKKTLNDLLVKIAKETDVYFRSTPPGDTKTWCQTLIQLADSFNALGKQLTLLENNICFKKALSFLERAVSTNLAWTHIEKTDLDLKHVDYLSDLYDSFEHHNILAEADELILDFRKAYARLKKILERTIDSKQQASVYLSCEHLGEQILELGNSCFQFDSIEKEKRYLDYFNLVEEIGMFLFYHEYKNNLLEALYFSLETVFQAHSIPQGWYTKMSAYIYERNKPTTGEFTYEKIQSVLHSDDIGSFASLRVLCQHLHRWGVFVLKCHEQNECRNFENSALAEYFSKKDNKIIFQSLMERFGRKLASLQIPGHTTTTDHDLIALNNQFSELKERCRLLENIVEQLNVSQLHQSPETSPGSSSKQRLITQFFNPVFKRKAEDEGERNSKRQRIEKSDSLLIIGVAPKK